MGKSFPERELTQRDRDLLVRVRAGDEEAYRALYEQYRPMAERFARSRLTNNIDADDVVSEVFVSVFVAVGKGKGPLDSFAPYLMASLRNECYRMNRRRAEEARDQRRRRRLGHFARTGGRAVCRHRRHGHPPRRVRIARSEVAGLAVAH